MALGYCEALLVGLAEVAKENAPENKVTYPGFLNAVLENSSKPQVLSVDQGDGHRKIVRVKYQPRGVMDNTTTTPGCDINVIQAYSEVNVDVTGYRQVAIYLDDATIKKYCSEASQMVSSGGLTPMMREHLSAMLRQLNGMYQGIDSDLLTTMAASFGTNVNTGNNTSKVINISKDTQIQSLSDGITEVLKDYMENEGCGTPIVVGNGLFHSFVLQQMAKSADQSGINTTAFNNMYKFYWDALTISKFGANQIGVFQPNAVQLVEYNEFQGAFAGHKGTSDFGTFVDPRIQCNGPEGINSMKFDFQLKYYDCPFTAVVNGVNTVVNRGWALIISKNYQLFTLPTNAYLAGDRLTGNNGTNRYTITNDCATC